MSPATAAAQTKPAAATLTPLKTAWGDPDLQGVWTSDDSIGVPFERPRRYGNRKQLTEEEFAERAQENSKISTSVQSGVNPQTGYWVQHEGVDAEPYSSNWTEYARRTSRQTCLIVDPEDGQLRPLKKEAMMVGAGSVGIRNEMIHETRLVPSDARQTPRPHLPDAMRTYMGDPRGHWEGNALVV